MFENKTENQAREEILELVKEYCDTFHNQKKPFDRETESPMHPVFMTIKRW